MSCKIYIALFVIFCLAQASNTRSTNNIGQRISPSDDDIIDTLNELINKIHISVENIEQVIQSLEDRIKEELDETYLTQIIAELEKRIEDVAEQSQTSFVVIVKCLVAQQPALRDLEYITTKGVEICQTKNEITKRLIEINVNAATSISHVTGGIMKCFNNHSADKLNCLGNLVEPSVEEVNSVLDEIESTIEDSHKLVKEAEQNLSECVDKVRKEIVKAENTILDNFHKCIRM